MSLKQVVVAGIFALAGASEEPVPYSKFVYTNTKICSEHHGSLCMTYATKKKHMMLSRSHHLDFEIEPLENNLGAVRIFTKRGSEDTKYCLIPKVEEKLNYLTMDLVECGTAQEELVLSVEAKHADKFVLKVNKNDMFSKELQAFDEPDNQDYCLSATYKNQVVHTRSKVHSGNYIALAKCSVESNTQFAYAQSFQALGYTTKQVTESAAEEAEPRFGRYCLQDKPELCMGVSLTNGTVLEGDKLIQVKNLTKNTNKGLYDLKLQWYRDLENNRLANAAVLDYCLKAEYNVTLGRNRRGLLFSDDVLSLAACSPDEDERFTVAEAVGGDYTELKAAADDACATVVRCVTYEDNEFCSQYNSFDVTSVEELEQGAYVRLKSCDSANSPGQRWVFTPDYLATNPPTIPPTTEAPVLNTPYPTAAPVGTEPLPSEPTPEPTPQASSPTQYPTLGEEGPKENEPEIVEVKNESESVGLTVGLVLVGILCIAIILVGALFYRRRKAAEEEHEEEALGDEETGNSATEEANAEAETENEAPQTEVEAPEGPATPEGENETFIARV